MNTKPKVVKPRRHEGGIPKLKGNQFPKEFLFFDTETNVYDLEHGAVEFPMRVGIAIYVKINSNHEVTKRHVFRFNTTLDFIQILKQYSTGKKTLYVFAHNIKFDIMVLNLPLILSDHDIRTKFPIINDRMFIWRADIKKARAVFIDTANFCVQSVEQLGDDLGYPKLHVDFKNVSDEDLLFYCRRDVEILEKFMLAYIKFVNENELGSFRLTLASQALAAWRKRFMRRTVHIHNEAKALTLERQSYHGGRTECFYIGTLPEEQYYYLDVNSMYPYVMKTSVVPNKLMYTVDECTVEKLSRYVRAHYVIADVELETNVQAYPLVAQGKLLFPTGTFRTVLHHRELSYAFAHKHIKNVYSLALYEYSNLFGYYVDFFYELKGRMKAEGNQSWYIISKYFLNSLYGKMAQTGVIQEITQGPYERIIRRIEGHRLNTHEYTSETNWFGTKVKEKREGESSYSFPACAGAITANARMLLWEYIECAGTQNVFYCDTDSLIVNAIGYRNIAGVLDNTNLGMLKLEKQSHYCEIYGAKDYEFGADKRVKGISLKAEQLTRNKWRVLQFDGILPWFNAGTDKPASAKYIEKSRISNYNKGTLTNNHGRVTPLEFTFCAECSQYVSLPHSHLQA